MKTLKLLIALIVITLTSCTQDNNDDTSTAPQTDGFTYNNTFYETPNAYFQFDDNNNPRKHYAFFFTDGRIFDNDANVSNSTSDYLFSTNTTKMVFLKIMVSDNLSLANNALPSAGNTYRASSVRKSVIGHGFQVNSLNPVYTNNGIEFGIADENTGTYHLPGTQGPTITINAINIDSNNIANSTINADYRFMNTNGIVITGHYEGTFGVILD